LKSVRPTGSRSYSLPNSCDADNRDKTKFENLHKSIGACDDVLSSVETNLTSFRNDLAMVSADIETLQARSEALNVRLENRKAVEKGLGPVVEEISVSPVVVAKISEGHIDEQWVLALREVDKRAAAYKSTSVQKESKAWADLGPLLEKLLQKVSCSKLPTIALGITLTAATGHRANTRLPGCSDQGDAVTTYQCSNYPAAELYQIQRTLLFLA
jgi:hypothetical protein